jgi:hypothetical protein
MTFYSDGRDFTDNDWPDGDQPRPDGEGAQTRFTLEPRITLAQMDAEPLEFLAPGARGFPRDIATLLTGPGGVFKTRMALQYLFAASLGEAPFGCPLLRPLEPLKCLYIGAEDGKRFFHYIARPILAARSDLTALPFDHKLLADKAPGFVLNRKTVRELADFLATVREARGGLDCVVLDPMLALIDRDYADMMKNPVIARAFYIDCLQPLFAAGNFALITNNHDSKSGAAVTGSADQQNAGRLVLQFRRGEASASGLKSIIIEQVKDNVGFRFQELVLDPQPETLALEWNAERTVYAYGAPPGHDQCDTDPTPPSDPSAIQAYLCNLAAKLVAPHLAPADQRGKRAVEGYLSQQAARDGHRKVREHVRRCLDAFCAFERDQNVRKGLRMVLCGVRNPNAAPGDHDDYLAGRAPAADPPESDSSEEATQCA